jgi:hypothetical protein
MAKNYYYLKLHYDILDDWKVGTLPDSLKWLFIQCLCVAGETFQGGLLPELNQFAFRIRREPSALNSDMARLAANGLTELVQIEDGSERWFVTNYAKRQKPISNKKKQADYRTRKRKKEMAESDDSVTDELPDRYDSVTIRNTDKIRLDKIRLDKDVDVYTRAPRYDGHEENHNQKRIDVMVALCNVTKGQDALMPSDDLGRMADRIIEQGKEDMIPGFLNWWTVNEIHYKGRPTLKSLSIEWPNYLDDPNRTKPASAAPTLDEVDALIKQLEQENSHVI